MKCAQAYSRATDAAEGKLGWWPQSISDEVLTDRRIAWRCSIEMASSTILHVNMPSPGPPAQRKAMIASAIGRGAESRTAWRFIIVTSSTEVHASRSSLRLNVATNVHVD
jgi:hypothetical protein